MKGALFFAAWMAFGSIIHPIFLQGQNGAGLGIQQRLWLSIAVAVVLFGFLLSFYLLIGRLKQQNESLNNLTDRLSQLLDNEEAQKRRLLEMYDKQAAVEKKIMDSIRYAKTIQLAILPSESLFQENFQDHFIIYKARDFVSGDFYWLRKQDGAGGQLPNIYLAVADCTGHGVPGALMSMMGYSFLDEIVNERSLLAPQDILTALHDMLQKALHQNQNMNSDGMDIGICRFERRPDGVVCTSFAGVGSSLYYAKPSDAELVRIRGRGTSIGGNRHKESNFKQYDLILAPGDAVYLFSDGWASQQGHDNRKMGTPRLLEGLSEVLGNPMDHQKKHLESILEKEMFGREQIDDITILGVQL